MKIASGQGFYEKITDKNVVIFHTNLPKIYRDIKIKTVYVFRYPQINEINSGLYVYAVTVYNTTKVAEILPTLDSSCFFDQLSEVKLDFNSKKCGLNLGQASQNSSGVEISVWINHHQNSSSGTPQ